MYISLDRSIDTANDEALTALSRVTAGPHGGDRGNQYTGGKSDNVTLATELERGNSKADGLRWLDTHRPDLHAAVLRGTRHKDSGQEVGRVPIGGGPDAIWYNAQRARLYVAIGQPGLLDVIDTQTMTVVERLTTEPGTGTSAWDAQRQRLYVFLPQSCRVACYAEN